MKIQLKSEQGMTLVEVLAATVIGTMIILTIGATMLFGLKQYQQQSVKAEDLTDVTYMAKIITKDIRRASEITEIDASSITLTIEGAVVAYRFDDARKTITKNGQAFSSNVEDLSFTLKEHKMLEIDIESEEHLSKTEKIKTQIYVGQKVK